MRALLGRDLGIGRRRSRAGEVALELAVQVIALAEAADQDDARDGLPLVAQVVDLSLDEVTDFLDDGVEDVFDLGRAHDHEAAVETNFFVVGEAGETK